MKKVLAVAGLVLAFSGTVWAQHTCSEAAPRELRAPTDAAVSSHQGRADFVLVEWEAVEAAVYYRLFREMPVREGTGIPKMIGFRCGCPGSVSMPCPKSKRCRP